MIFVDFSIKYPGKKQKWCHLMSDTSIEELKEFASRLGLKQAWFQEGSLPHFDLSNAMRYKAIRMGAQECATYEDLRNLFEKVRAYNK